MRGSEAPAPTIVGSSAPIRELDRRIRALARYDCTVLIQGESGTGKELTARQLHARSRRARGPFVPVDCTTLRSSLLESQLFGHVRGSFTGADRNAIGFFRAAEGGTIFLDELGELDLPIQAKLLRCIQDRAVVPLGEYAAIPVNVRVIAATHRDLREMVVRGTFREDLFYRLNVACVTVPSLRMRKEDVPALVQHAIVRLCSIYQRSPMIISDQAVRALADYDWPGNVRELINAIEHALVFSDGDEINCNDLPAAVLGRIDESSRPADITTLEQAERELITRTLRATGGNQSRAATLLAIERHRLRRRIIRYGLEKMVRAQPR